MLKDGRQRWRLAESAMSARKDELVTADVFTNLAREGRRPFGLRRLVYGVLRKIVHGATGLDLGSKKRTRIEESLEKSGALVGENKLHTIKIRNRADINSQHRLAGD